MKAPDKIFVRIEEMGDVWALDATTWENGGKEYISKDALMEWLNERYKSTISNVGCYTGHSIWAEVIEHINEM